MKQELYVRLSRKLVQRYGKWILLATLVLVILVSNLNIILILLLLTVCNVLSSSLMKGIPYLSRSIELMMFSTVIGGYAYGPKVGFFFGMFSCLIYYLGAGRISYYSLTFVPLYGITGLFAGLFSAYPIYQVGLVAAFLYILISNAIVILFFGARIHLSVVFFAINMTFNLILFKYLAPMVLYFT